MHYSPTQKTLIGEDKFRWPNMGSRKMETVIIENKLDAVIHAHAHYGTKYAEINGIPIYNVSLPLNKKIVEIKIE